MSDDSATTAPLTLPSTAPPVKPGATTSEHAFNYVCLALAAALGTGLIPTTGWVGQLAAIATAALLALGYNVGRVVLKSRAAAAAVLIFVLAFGAISATGCAGASAQEKALQTTFATAKAAEIAFVAYDVKHQSDLVDVAKTKADGAAALASYRASRGAVSDGFAALYKAIAAAALAKDNNTMDAVTLAGGAVEAALHAIGVTP